MITSKWKLSSLVHTALFWDLLILVFKLCHAALLKNLVYCFQILLNMFLKNIKTHSSEVCDQKLQTARQNKDTCGHYTVNYLRVGTVFSSFTLIVQLFSVDLYCPAQALMDFGSSPYRFLSTSKQKKYLYKNVVRTYPILLWTHYEKHESVACLWTVFSATYKAL